VQGDDLIGRYGDLARGNGEMLESDGSDIAERDHPADAAEAHRTLVTDVGARPLHIGTTIVHRHVGIAAHLHGRLHVVRRHGKLGCGRANGQHRQGYGDCESQNGTNEPQERLTLSGRNTTSLAYPGTENSR